MGLLLYQPLGRNRDAHRLWIESKRLETLGFSPGTPFSVEVQPERLILRPAILANNHVSSRPVPDGRRPIIDLADQAVLRDLGAFSELRVIASFARIEISPSRRAFAIRKSRSLAAPLRVLEVFAGRGTLTAAFAGDSRFLVTAGIEIAPEYADVWQTSHPDALLVQADLRAVEAASLPEFDILVGGIPCTSHSNLGRAKKGLAGRPELGDTGDLFLPVCSP